MFLALFWGLAAVLVPLTLYVPGDPQYYRSAIYAGLTGVALLSWGSGRSRYSPIFIPILLLAVWNFYAEGFSHLYKLFGLLWGVLLFNHLAGSAYDWRRVVANFLRVAGLCQAVWVLCNWYGVNPMLWYPGMTEEKISDPHGFLLAVVPVTGSLLNKFYTGGYLAALVPFYFTRRWIYAAPILVVAVVVCDTATSLIPMIGAVGLLGGLWARRNLNRRYVVGAGLILALTGVLAVQGMGRDFLFMGERVRAWGDTVRLADARYVVMGQGEERVVYAFPGNGFIGRGFGLYRDNFWKIFNTRYREHFTHPHNEPLYVYFAFGLVGVSLLLILLFLVGKVVLSKDFDSPIYAAGFFAILINSLGNFPLHVPDVGFLTVVLLAGTLWTRNDKSLWRGCYEGLIFIGRLFFSYWGRFRAISLPASHSG